MVSRHGPLAILTGLGIALLGLALAVGGWRLTSLGGTWFYLIAGAGLLVTGALIGLRRAEALWLYAAVVLATVVWALAEAGLTWWSLTPRGDLIFPIAVWLLLLPWLSRDMARAADPAKAKAWRTASLPLLAVTGLAVLVGGLALAFGNGSAKSGTLPSAAAAPPHDYAGVPDADWRAYGRSNYGDRYSPLTQITPENVSRLKVAWTFNIQDVADPNDPVATTFELTPLKVDDTVYLCTAHAIVIALDAETGQQKWRYDPHISVTKSLQHLTCRGVSYHRAYPGAPPAPNGECPERIFIPTADTRLIALDARTGQLCRGFGVGGQVDLWQGMPRRQAGFYYSTSPPLVTRDRVIIGGSISDNYSTDEPSGVVRAFDVNTGRLIWNWDPARPDETAPLAPGKVYTHNSPNTWGVFSADEDLGLVYLPMGNETPDTWGGHRNPVAEQFSSAVVALDIGTGKVRWAFQTVHHDLWDMDIGSQPTLVDLKTPQGQRPAVIAPTKRGDIFILDRRTGDPLFPVEERPVPQGAAPGDHTSPTQPYSAVTFLPPKLREKDLWGATLLDQMACRIQFRQLRYEGVFTPPSTQGTLDFPGNFGVFDWGGLAVDPVRQIAFANPNYVAFVFKLIPRANDSKPITDPVGAVDPQDSPQIGTPFAVKQPPFLSILRLPCIAPPWGYVAGMDLTTGKTVWMRKNGTVRDSYRSHLPFKMGIPSLAGPITTAGGVAFLTSSMDFYARGYDVRTGREIWQARLPTNGRATPISYRSQISGRQFLVFAVGGNGPVGTTIGGQLYAYALPRD